MDILLFLILAGALAWLWSRVGALARQVALLERALDAGPPAHSGRAADELPIAPQTIVEAARPLVTVPVTASRAKAADVPVAQLPEPLPEPDSPRFRFDFEDLFGRLLPIWAGGVTLAVAGFFLVRWSIEAGLLTPRVRVFLAGLFGLALLAGAETAYRWRERVADPRVAQALAGAGLATLYAAFYLAGSTYGLIGPGPAFIGLAAVTSAAIGLSFRFGLPSAVLALVGGFAAPALVGSEDANLPLLTLYLALVTAGLTYTGNRQGRAWLGLAALGGGLLWGGILVSTLPTDPGDIAVLGAYLVALGAVLPGLGAGGPPERWLQVAGSALAALQLAVLVANGGFGALEWSLYLTLGAALAWFGWREETMRTASAMAAAIAVLMLLVWSDPAAGMFSAVAMAVAAIFAGVPVIRLWLGRGAIIDLAQATGATAALACAVYWHFGQILPDAPDFAVAGALAALGGVAAMARWATPRSPQVDVRWSLAPEGVAAALAYGAIAQVVPHEALAWIAGILGALAAWRAPTLLGASVAFIAFAVGWAFEPSARWFAEALDAAAGDPLAAVDLPTVRSLALYVLPPALAASVLWLRRAGPRPLPGIAAGIALALALVIAHTFYRHAFAGVAGSDFAATGVMQRAVWEAALVGAAWLCLLREWRRAAAALAAAALAHFAWFALVLHNPLLSTQAVGLLPVANALVALYGAGLASLVLARKLVPSKLSAHSWIIDAAVMAVLSLLALSELRSLFSPSLLAAEPVGATEDLLRSLLGIVLAVAFLFWGARAGKRSWRVGSLVLMVVAVLKVFLVDAAGLDGLARIGSFMALGFSLIGIGWFYNRQLRNKSPV